MESKRHSHPTDQRTNRMIDFMEHYQPPKPPRKLYISDFIRWSWFWAGLALTGWLAYFLK